LFISGFKLEAVKEAVMKAKRFINLMAIYAAFAVLLSAGAVAAKEGRSSTTRNTTYY
jgi:hypothetical protein